MADVAGSIAASSASTAERAAAKVFPSRRKEPELGSPAGRLAEQIRNLGEPAAPPRAGRHGDSSPAARAVKIPAVDVRLARLDQHQARLRRVERQLLDMDDLAGTRPSMVQPPSKPAANALQAARPAAAAAETARKATAAPAAPPQPPPGADRFAAETELVKTRLELAQALGAAPKTGLGSVALPTLPVLHARL